MGYDNTQQATKGIIMKKPVEAKFADKAGIKQSVVKKADEKSLKVKK